MSSPQSSGSRKVSGKEACDEDWSCASTGFALGMGCCGLLSIGIPADQKDPG